MAFRKERVIKAAEKLVAKGKIEKAIVKYKEVLSKDGDDPNITNMIGDLYRRLRKTSEAAQFWGRTADSYERAGFLVKAIAVHKKIQRADAGNVEIHRSLSRLYHKQGLVPDARQHYLQLVGHFERSNDPASMITIYQKLIDLEPENPSNRVRLAQLYRDQKLTAKAMDEYANIASMMVQHQEFDQAVQVYAKALEIDDTDEGFVSDAIRTLLHGGGRDAARQLHSMAIVRHGRFEKLEELFDPPAARQSLGGAPEVPATARDLPGANTGGFELIGQDGPDALEASSAEGPGDLVPGDSLTATGLGSTVEAVTDDDLVGTEITGEGAALSFDESMIDPPAAAPMGDFDTAPDVLAAETSESDTSIEAPLPGDEAVSLETDAELGDFVIEFNDTEETPGSRVEPPPDMAASAAPGMSTGELEEMHSRAPGFEFVPENPETSGRPSDHGALDLAANSGGFEMSDDGEILLDEVPDPSSSGLSVEAVQDQLEASLPEVSVVDEEAVVIEAPAVDAPEVESPLVEAAELEPLPEISGGFETAPEVTSAGDAVDIGDLDLGDLAEIDLRDSQVTAAADEIVLDDIEFEDTSLPPSAPIPLGGGSAETDPAQVAADNLEQETPVIDSGAAAAAQIPDELKVVNDLLAEAEVFVKYGLAAKAVDRLEEVLRLDPSHLGAATQLIRLHLQEGEHAKVEPLFNALYDDVRETGAMELWEELKSDLANSGYEIEGERVVGLPGGSGVGRAVLDADDESETETASEGALAGAGGGGLVDLAALGSEIDAEITAEEEVGAAAMASDVSAINIEANGASGLDSLNGSVDGESQPVEAAGLAWLDEPATEAQETAGDAPDLFEDEKPLFDLAAELQEEFAAPAAAAPMTPEEQSLEDIVEGFKKGVAENLSQEDADTHYNLGIAYREMMLLDEAIGEFQIAAKDETYLVDCCAMLGLCFREKGLPELAMKWYTKAIDSGLLEGEQELGMLYEVAMTHIEQNDNQAAYQAFVDLYGMNTNYRDVATKMAELQEAAVPT